MRSSRIWRGHALDRQLHDTTSILWFAVASIVFVGLGLVFKSRLLNWFFGPLFPVLLLHVLPAVARRSWRWLTHRPLRTIHGFGR